MISRGILFVSVCYCLAVFELATHITLSCQPRVHFSPLADVIVESVGYVLLPLCLTFLLAVSPLYPLTTSALRHYQRPPPLPEP